MPAFDTPGRRRLYASALARLAAASVILCLSQPAWGADPKGDLQGTWSAIAAERDGGPASDLIGHRIDFAGDHFQISGAAGVLFGGRFALGAAEVPAPIDFKIEEGNAKGQSWLGIFKIENGLLTICDNAGDPAAARQRDFGAPKGSGYVCLTFKR